MNGCSSGAALFVTPNVLNSACQPAELAQVGCNEWLSVTALDPHQSHSRGARFVHVSGQVGVSPQGDLPPDFDGQCRQAVANVRAVLEQAGMTLADVVKMSFFLVRREDMAGLVVVRKELLDGVRPAVTTVIVAELVQPDWLVEIEAVACAA